MRRKSERNKAKGSPEKKVEKATRKSTRRRGKRSPSVSPKRDECDTETIAPSVSETEEPSNTLATETTVVASTETKLPTNEEADTVNLSPEEDNNGSVWKVARADASPGEIQKLKLCRQRNISEASSDNSVERKKSNKWQESGEGVGEEDDSVDEPMACSQEALAEDSRDESCSRRPGRESNDEEVSDSKESPPETTSANLSDAMQNADRQGDEQTAAADDNDNQPKQLDDNESESVTESVTESATETAKVVTENVSNADCSMESTKSNIVDNDVVVVEQVAEQEVVADDGKQEKVCKESESSDEENSRRSDSSSNDEETEKSQAKIRSTVTTTRRKHRDKYHESSNSESNDSEDEQEVDKAKVEDVREKSSLKDNDNDYEERDNESKSPGEELMKSGMKNEDNEQEKVEPVKNEVEMQKTPQKEVDKVSNQQAVENNAQTTAQKPTKVNLKRSFARTTDSGVKKDNGENSLDSEAAENKENCATEAKIVSKRRRWGTTLTSDVTPTFSVSTDSLKALVPEAKPLSLNEVRLTKDDDIDNRKPRDRKHSLNNSIENQKNKEDSVRKIDSMDNHIGKRKISIVKESHINSPSPPAVKPTNILLIKNLVRPFTLNQIKELLSRTGQIVENGFWMDRIKSKCYVEYSNEDQAFETRQALHGISWPLSNPKKLQVEYATKEDMQAARESSKDQPISRKAETVASTDNWQQGWNQEEKNNTAKVTVVREWDLGKEDGQVHLKEKEREKKDDKKRRQRSTSPSAEAAHLPPPARKFKKKEDEPPPAKLLDDLFRKTKTTPCIYWLPLTNEQIAIKKEMRRQHMAEHARRLEEMRRVERNRDRDRDRDRRRRSPRK